MANILFLEDLSAAAALSASGAVTGAPGANLQLNQPGIAWHVASNAPHLTIDFGVPKVIDTIGLLYTNLTDKATFELWADNAEANLGTGSAAFRRAPTVAPSKMPLDERGWRHGLAYFRSFEAYRYWRIAINNIGNADATTWAGRLMMGKRWEPTYNLNRDWDMSRVDPTTRPRMVGGQMRVLVEPYWHRFSMRFDWLSREEALTALLPLADRARSRDIWVIKDADDALWEGEAVYGLVTSERRYREPWHGYYFVDIMMEERRA